MKLPFRTGATPLTDDELILLDVLFRGWPCPARLLRKRDFLFQWNFGYSHDLDDRQLRATLTGLHDRDLVRPELAVKDVCFVITPAGGELWSRERLPAWDSYFDTSCRITRSGRTTMKVLAFSAELRNRFLDLCPNASAERRRRTVRRGRLIEWRPPRRVYLGAAGYFGTDLSPATDVYWDRLERERIGWQNVRQLQRFLPAS